VVIHNTNESNLLNIGRVNWRVDDFCVSHGIGRTYFYDEVKRGQIKTFKVGKRTLISDIEAKSWQSRKVEATL
jgi:hypothetical protein